MLGTCLETIALLLWPELVAKKTVIFISANLKFWMWKVCVPISVCFIFRLLTFGICKFEMLKSGNLKIEMWKFNKCQLEVSKWKHEWKVTKLNTSKFDISQINELLKLKVFEFIVSKLPFPNSYFQISKSAING